MNAVPFTLAGVPLLALGSGALFWADRKLLCVSDLHIGKAERQARLGGAQLPPYETHDTLQRLEQDLQDTGATTVVCLGDTFDDNTAMGELTEGESLWITRLQAGRKWIWIEGNHDPGPVTLGGTHLAELPQPPLVFRHIAQPGSSGELSGHYHPKARMRARGQSLSRPCFLVDSDRVILPSFGTYTGGLRSTDEALTTLMRPEALAILTGPVPRAIPMPR